MKPILKKLSVALFIAFVGLSLGASGNVLYAEWTSTCTGPGEIGMCPDFGSSSAEDAACSCACQTLMSVPGACDGGCCACAT
jgi:hypothetical protein